MQRSLHVSSQTSAHDLPFIGLAAVLGLGIGWLDVHTTEVIVTIVALVGAGIVLGLMRPPAAWRWGVLIAAGLLVMTVAVKLAGLQTAEPVTLDPRVTLVTLVFALGGSYAGALLRRAAQALGGGKATP